MKCNKCESTYIVKSGFKKVEEGEILTKPPSK